LLDAAEKIAARPKRSAFGRKYIDASRIVLFSMAWKNWRERQKRIEHAHLGQ